MFAQYKSSRLFLHSILIKRKALAWWLECWSVAPQWHIPAQETYKHYKRRKTKVVIQPKSWFQFRWKYDISFFFRTKLFLTPQRPCLITFTTKSHLRRETHIRIYILHPKKANVSEGTFPLCVENVMLFSDPFFLLITSWCRSTPHIKGFRGHIRSKMFCT